MKSTKSAAITMAAFILGMTALSTYAQPPKGNKPPKEAIEACVEKSEGDTVSFLNRRGDKVEGTCKLIEDQLVAVPADHERPPRPTYSE